MFKSVFLGRPFGIATYIHWSFWILLLYIAAQYIPYGIEPVIYYVGLTVAVFACIVCHELGHALMAREFGIRTYDIHLYPIGGVARLERIPEQPLQEFLIAIAGPMVNVVIAFVLFGALGFNDHWFPNAEVLSGAAKGILGIVHALAAINVALALFNLLPAFPMDGGRVFRALLATKFGHLRATEIAAEVGKYMAVLMAIYGFANGQFSLMLLALFVYLSGKQEHFMVLMR
ncbi:MAG: site-2 protease family protein [Planctomycetota bacterium]